MKEKLVDTLMLLWLSLRLQLGKRFWAVPLLTLAWPAFQALALVAGWRDEAIEPVDAQNALIGIPLVVLAIGLGVRIIAGEIEQRTLEVTYTVPGGARRVWVSKILAAVLLLAAAEGLLAIVVAAFLVPYPLTALYGAMQAAVVYLVLAMGLGALLRSEITAVLVVAVVLLMNGLMTGFGGMQTRLSPFFNPMAVDEENQAELLAWTIQNRIGMVLLVLALIALACVRAERREALLRA